MCMMTLAEACECVPVNNLRFLKCSLIVIVIVSCGLTKTFHDEKMLIVRCGK